MTDKDRTRNHINMMPCSIIILLENEMIRGTNDMGKKIRNNDKSQISPI